MILGVGEAHIDAGKHGEAPEADGGEGQRNKDTNPETNWDQLPTLPLWAKLPSVHLEQEVDPCLHFFYKNQ